MTRETSHYKHGLLTSVVIPNYNHGQYVGDAIRSVLNQEYRNFEIIVVDDGSTDNSREVVAKFGDHVRYIWQENQGLSAARNTGIRAANGVYIALLDADDMYEPHFLKKLVSTLRENPEAAGCYCGYQFVDHINNPLPQIEARQIPDGELFRALLDGNFLVPESMLVHRQCYEEVGLFDETLAACEDWDMWLKITSQYKIVGTTEILTRHRILPGSMSTDPIRMHNNRLAVLEKHFGSAPSNESGWDSVERRAYGQAYLASMVEYLQYQDEEVAYHCFLKMVNVCPGLLTKLNTFYELGLGGQPKGFRGHFPTVDVPGNEQVIRSMLEKLFSGSNVQKGIKQQKSSIYATHYFALGLLEYGAGHFPSAKRYLLKAVRLKPGYLFEPQVRSTLIKSFLGIRLVNWFRQTRQEATV